MRSAGISEGTGRARLARCLPRKTRSEDVAYARLQLSVRDDALTAVGGSARSSFRIRRKRKDSSSSGCGVVGEGPAYVGVVGSWAEVVHLEPDRVATAGHLASTSVATNDQAPDGRGNRLARPQDESFFPPERIFKRCESQVPLVGLAS